MKLPPRAQIPHTLRRICRRVPLAVAVVSVLAVPVAVAQQPLQEQILGRRIPVPPIAERIDVRPIEDQVGSFSGLKSPHATRIYGVVINELGVVLPAAGTVIIRSLADGRAVAQTKVDALGQFSIREIDSGMYIAELVNASGSILTSSPAFTVGVGQVVQLTPVVSQHTFGGLAQFLSSGTTSAVNSAITASILTVAPLPPVSPER